MQNYTLEIGGKEYALVLKTRNLVELERKIGMNPLDILTGDHLAPVNVQLEVLTEAFRANHPGMDRERVMDLIDQYIADGHAMIDLLGVIVEIYNASGLVQTGAGDEKNA